MICFVEVHTAVGMAFGHDSLALVLGSLAFVHDLRASWVGVAYTVVAVVGIVDSDMEVADIAD